MRPARLALLAALLAPIAIPAQTTRNVIPGVEVLLTDSLHLMRGKRVGLLTNHSGRDRKGTSTIDLLFKAPGVKLTALFGPEHGIRGVAKAGEKIDLERRLGDRREGVLAVRRRAGADSRDARRTSTCSCTTFRTSARASTRTSGRSRIAANAAKKPVIVLDRPDPIRADRIEGNILDPKFASLVGQYPVALRYGLTPGELLRFLAGTKLIDAELHVVPMKNYRRSMWFDETGDSAGESVAEPPLARRRAAVSGHGVLRGHDGDRRARHRCAVHADRRVMDDGQRGDRVGAQRDASLPGVRFDTATRTIEPGYKFGGQTIPMIKVRVTDRNAVRPVEVGVRMLRAIYARHPKDFQWRRVDRSAGRHGQAARRGGAEHRRRADRRVERGRREVRGDR